MALLMLAASAAPAMAEQLVTSLSSHRVAIASNFTGDELALFGTIVNPDPRRTGPTAYDIVVTVRGPKRTLVARRKEVVLGLWVNTGSRQFVEIPAYLAVLATRRPRDIAPEAVLRRQQIGLDHILLPQRLVADIGDIGNIADEYRAALIRLKGKGGLYSEEPTGVTFLTPGLFRARISIPASAPVGSYEVETQLLADGTVLAREVSAFELFKVGFEAQVERAATEHPVLYGIAAVVLALFTGWGASVVFRKD
jgi:uncharacterized protein (TIGR02186 family)